MKGGEKMRIKNRSIQVTLFCIFLIILCVSLFSTWGYQAVQHILGTYFDVQTESTLYDIFIGIIGMIGSALIVTGSIMLWNMKKKGSFFMMLGATAFIIKNILDIINDVVPLTRLAQVTSENITDASWKIGWDLFQMAFWIFIIVFFNRKSFKASLS
jgi:hypothetical protein